MCNIAASASVAAEVRERMLLVLKRGLEHNRCAAAAAACVRTPLMCLLPFLHACACLAAHMVLPTRRAAGTARCFGHCTFTCTASNQVRRLPACLLAGQQAIGSPWCVCAYPSPLPPPPGARTLLFCGSPLSIWFFCGRPPPTCLQTARRA